MGAVAFRAAIRDGLAEEMERDEGVFLMGEDIGPGGVFNVTPGLLDRFGPRRVIDTPISELAFMGAAFGAAMQGMRPVVEIMFSNFLPLALDSLINQAARLPFVTNEQITAPLVVRTTVGGGVGYGPLHSEVPTNWVLAEPGLKVLAPSTPADAKALIKAAIRDREPVVFFEHKLLYDRVGEVPDDGEAAAIGEAATLRSGDDVTIVAAMAMVEQALEAADGLRAQDVGAEVIDLRSLRPLDSATVLASAARTRHVVVVEEGNPVGGYAAELLACVVENLPGARASRLTMPNVPVPFSPPLEQAIRPTAARIADAALRLLGRADGKPVESHA
jgi:acetoin:2,6-dichlorophenolindophenol oxidoreductase subunit beta